MEWVEKVARSVEEAKDLALDALGVDEQDAEFEVLEEPRPGLFGRLRGEARVRARVRPTQPRPKIDRRERRKSAKSRAEGGRAAKGRGRERSRTADGGAEAPDSADGAVGTDASRDRAEVEGSGGGQRRSGSTRGRGKRPAARGGAGGKRSKEEAGDTGPTSEGEAGSDRTRKETPKVTIDAVQQGEIVKEFLEGLAGAFGVSGTATLETVEEDIVEIHLESEDDLGYLIGPKGNTITAIHELAKAVVNHRADGERTGRFRVDVGSYRAKRREALARFATKLAEEVRDTATPKLLEPMGAADRKVVHDTVNEIEGVATESVGAEPRRRVKIVPAG